MNVNPRGSTESAKRKKKSLNLSDVVILLHLYFINIIRRTALSVDLQRNKLIKKNKRLTNFTNRTKDKRISVRCPFVRRFLYFYDRRRGGSGSKLNQGTLGTIARLKIADLDDSWSRYRNEKSVLEELDDRKSTPADLYRLTSSLSSSFSRYELEIEHANIDLGAPITRSIVVKGRKKKNREKKKRVSTSIRRVFSSVSLDPLRSIDARRFRFSIDSHSTNKSLLVRRVSGSCILRPWGTIEKKRRSI